MNTRLKTSIKGYLEHITYYNQENFFTIAKLRTDKTGNLITVKGYMPDPHLGETMELTGNWEAHPKYGQQFNIEAFEVILPATMEAIQKYLASGVVKGIGTKMAARLINHFQERTLKVIEEHSEKLTEVPGIGKAKAASIANAWRTHHTLRNLMQFLKDMGVKSAYAARIFKEYGPDALNIIQNEPFRLSEDIPRIGFYIADAIVQKSGMPVDDPGRVAACIKHLLNQVMDDGHVFTEEDQLIDRCERVFHISRDAVSNSLKILAEEKEVILESDAAGSGMKYIYLKMLHEAETGIADRMNAMLSVPLHVPKIDSEQMTRAVVKKLAIQLSLEQIQVLEGILSHRVAILTGGPGTGKTTLIKSITAILEFLGMRVLLAAPTGRAARRLSEVTRRKATTIHRLLGYRLADARFEKNQRDPLDIDALIIDEASMVDLFLMYHLLNAVPVNAMLILVGDVFQLPSVGPGSILSDLINAKRIKTFELKEIFRQSQESPIVINAHRIRRGEPPLFNTDNEATDPSQFYFIQKNDPSEAVQTIVELCNKAVPERFSLDPVDEIQVLTPMHKGEVGTLNLNQMLQDALNPGPDVFEIYGARFKPGDKVMHLKNNYIKEVFNGDIGRICSIDPSNQNLSVDFDGSRTVAYDFTELDELTLAYAISVHKSQGSEYPAVIIPIMTQHFALLQRNLLYTAITRGKILVVLVGTQKALSIALKNDTPRKRNSALSHRLVWKENIPN